MERNILLENSAVKEVLQTLKCKIRYGWHNYRLINKNRYAIVYGLGSPNIAILLKSDFFNSFGRKFADKGEKGVGDSINVDSLKAFVKEGVKTIYVLFRDGKLYSISLMDFLINSYRWIQKEGTDVRSISIHKYKKVI